LDGPNRTEADFYTYRYLANARFIPGYNFPREPAVIAGMMHGHRATAVFGTLDRRL
jgi:hypothetical protein